MTIYQYVGHMPGNDKYLVFTGGRLVLAMMDSGLLIAAVKEPFFKEEWLKESSAWERVFPLESPA